MVPSLRIAAVAATLFASAVLAAPPSYGGSTNSSSLPVVDLGYEIHQAALYNESGRFYNFSNIRYAAPPTGQNRFRAPQPPEENRGEVQTGSQGRICPQAAPAWGAISAQFIPEYLAGQTEFNQSSFNLSSSGEAPAVDPRTNEDCLFMDVVVPQAIFENAGHGGQGAAVLVWIYGGGYTAGSKSGSGNPAGLIKRSQSEASEGVIYVSFNYRLGAMGWLSGPTFQENGTANAGLHDQRFALEWIQRNIHLFGGDPNRVTIFGESAGGGSVMHQMTAYGGRDPVPFAQALPQSPGWLPVVSNQQQEQVFMDFLNYANVSSLAEARELSSEQVILANAQQVGGAAFGNFVYGPTVDGDFVTTLPGVALLHGQFPKNVKVMVGHNAQEGLLFTSPFIQNNTDFNTFLSTSLPTLRAWPSVLSYITDTLYPPTFDGSQAQNYTNQIARAAALTSELVFTCNTNYLNRAYGNNTYAYYFTIPPALHGQDVAYTYFNGPSEDVQDDEIAIALQEYITSWAMTGNPNSQGVPFFPIQGANATVQELDLKGVDQVMDPTANERCAWWQKALYL